MSEDAAVDMISTGVVVSVRVLRTSDHYQFSITIYSQMSTKILRVQDKKITFKTKLNLLWCIPAADVLGPLGIWLL